LTKRTRIFIGILVAYALGVGFLMYRQLGDIDPRYRESAEDSLVDTAQLMAALVENASAGGVLRTDALEPVFRSLYARRFQADIYGVEKTRVELRMTVVDRQGTVVFDSRAAAARSGAASASPRRRRRSAPTTRAGTTSTWRCAAATARARRPTSKAIRAPR
jgi:hypothetical protein